MTHDLDALIGWYMRAPYLSSAPQCFAELHYVSRATVRNAVSAAETVRSGREMSYERVERRMEDMRMLDDAVIRRVWEALGEP